MKDLFSVDRVFEKLPVRDADISILHGADTPLPYDTMLRRLVTEVKWRQESVRIYGKVHPQPRLVAWYGDAGKQYDYSGISLTPIPWTNILLEQRRLVEELTNEKFNSVFLNLYRNENDSMGFHSDDEKELGREPIIASLSLGATRDFIFKHKMDKDLAVVRLPLEAGALLLMRGTTQRFWKHGILKEKRPCGPRINLTFRTIFK
jgi:alkylated DNA repair dioxygenase AlkB